MEYKEIEYKKEQGIITIEISHNLSSLYEEEVNLSDFYSDIKKVEENTEIGLIRVETNINIIDLPKETSISLMKIGGKKYNFNLHRNFDRSQFNKTVIEIGNKIDNKLPKLNYNNCILKIILPNEVKMKIKLFLKALPKKHDINMLLEYIRKNEIDVDNLSDEEIIKGFEQFKSNKLID